MSLLSLCIPNYNRKKELLRLLREVILQIKEGSFENDIAICVSDDCSQTDPKQLISHMQEENPDIEIIYRRNEENMGMDRNFLDSVLMANTEYCWIIGNDDLVETQGLFNALKLIRENDDYDFIVSPFDIYDENDSYISTTWPLNTRKPMVYDTSDMDFRKELFMSIVHNSGIFGFLSNVIIRRENWVIRKDLFVDKMGSIFIQMYINIDTLISGCRYLYTDKKLIRNYSDKKTNLTMERMSRILFGLDDVTEFFFTGEVKDHFKRVLTDAYIVGELWELPDGSDEKDRVVGIVSGKNEIYRKYYIKNAELPQRITGRDIIIFGAGEYGLRTFEKVRGAGGRIKAFADSSIEKRGSIINDVRVISKDDMINEYKKGNTVILVANHHYLPEMTDFLLSNYVDNIGVVV